MSGGPDEPVAELVPDSPPTNCCNRLGAFLVAAIPRFIPRRNTVPLAASNPDESLSDPQNLRRNSLAHRTPGELFARACTLHFVFRCSPLVALPQVDSAATATWMALRLSLELQLGARVLPTMLSICECPPRFRRKRSAPRTRCRIPRRHCRFPLRRREPSQERRAWHLPRRTCGRSPSIEAAARALRTRGTRPVSSVRPLEIEPESHDRSVEHGLERDVPAGHRVGGLQVEKVVAGG